ncbi:MAG: hypothetical protein LAO20_21250 [Acidobacteriia bacterium]|nr:hypothetical protein [Terriglobia bacterium]
MSQLTYRNENSGATNSAPELRYAYYRRCQVFRKNGEQCKAPAEKGAHICYAHAGQHALAARRERERRAVLEEVVRRMRSRGRGEFGPADISMDFNAIQVTLAVMAEAVIDGRMDCKTAGKLAVTIQMAAKLLALYHGAHKGTKRKKEPASKDAHRLGSRPIREQEVSPQICAGERRTNRSIGLAASAAKREEAA